MCIASSDGAWERGFIGMRLSVTNQHQNETQYGNETTYLTEGGLRSVAGVQRSKKLHIVGITLHNRSCLTTSHLHTEDPSLLAVHMLTERIWKLNYVRSMNLNVTSAE